VKFDGCYHGHADSLLVKAGSGGATFGIPDSRGVPAALASLTLTLPFNDLGAVRELFRARGVEIAALIVEPVAGNMGVVPPAPGFLAGLREITAAHGSLLIFDEVITGFRVAYGGAQELYGVRPDLTCLGKIIGGGLPVGAFGGRRDIMKHYDPHEPGAFAHAGTFNNNVITHAAGATAMTQIYTPEVAEAFNGTGDAMRGALNGVIDKHGLPMTVTGLGTAMKIHTCTGPICNEHDADRGSVTKDKLIYYDMLARGQRMTWRNSMLLSLPLSDADRQGFVDAFDDVLGARAHLLAIE
jgi:glutamate-1-semialdehyde 2,1-aminomutase